MTNVQCRCEVKLYKKAVAQAEKEGISLSAWVRKLIIAKCEAEPIEARVSRLEDRIEKMSSIVSRLEMRSR
jgi:hypothetical protein